MCLRYSPRCEADVCFGGGGLGWRVGNLEAEGRGKEGWRMGVIGVGERRVGREGRCVGRCVRTLMEEGHCR